MKIFKYTIKRRHRSGWQTVEAPSVFNVLDVQNQLDQICIWAEVAEGLPNIKHHFGVVHTGEEVPDGSQHVGTVQFTVMTTNSDAGPVLAAANRVYHVYKKIR